MEKENYTPINCNLYDQLEAYAVKRTLLNIEFEDEKGNLIQQEMMFTNFTIENGAEYGFLNTKQGELKIRLDRIKTINGHNLIDEFGKSCTLPSKA